MKQEILIALGSNLGSLAGDNVQTLCAALSALTIKTMTLRRISRFYATPCFPKDAGPDFVNACCVFDTEMTPDQVLACLHEVEASFGRERKKRWGSRTLDLDLLGVGDVIAPDTKTQTDWRELNFEDQFSRVPSELILPHPRLQERGFVLVPLHDVAPFWRHPVTGLSVAEMLSALPASALDGITAI